VGAPHVPARSRSCGDSRQELRRAEGEGGCGATRAFPKPFPEAACLPKIRCYNSRPPVGGAVAQLGERLVRNEKVRSSILLGSTNFPALTGFVHFRPRSSVDRATAS
jgi:hypothetical protein